MDSGGEVNQHSPSMVSPSPTREPRQWGSCVRPQHPGHWQWDVVVRKVTKGKGMLMYMSCPFLVKAESRKEERINRHHLWCVTLGFLQQRILVFHVYYCWSVIDDVIGQTATTANMKYSPAVSPLFFPTLWLRQQVAPAQATDPTQHVHYINYNGGGDVVTECRSPLTQNITLLIHI